MTEVTHDAATADPRGTTAVAWAAVITVLFMLPQVSPVTWETFDYAPLAVLAVLGFAATRRLVSSRHWFLKPSDPDHTPTSTRKARTDRSRRAMTGPGTDTRSAAGHGAAMLGG